MTDNDADCSDESVDYITWFLTASIVVDGPLIIYRETRNNNIV